MCGLCSTVMTEDLHQIPQRGQNVWRAVGCPEGSLLYSWLFISQVLDEVRRRVNWDGFLKDSGKWVTNFWHRSPRSVPSKNTNFLSDEFLLGQANKLQVWGGIRVRGVARSQVLTLLIVPAVCVCIHWPIARPLSRWDLRACRELRAHAGSARRRSNAETPETSMSATSFSSLSVTKHLTHCHTICRLRLIQRGDLSDDISEGDLSFQLGKEDFDVSNMICRKAKHMLSHCCECICSIWNVLVECLWLNWMPKLVWSRHQTFCVPSEMHKYQPDFAFHHNVSQNDSKGCMHFSATVTLTCYFSYLSQGQL